MAEQIVQIRHNQCKSQDTFIHSPISLYLNRAPYRSPLSSTLQEKLVEFISRKSINSAFHWWFIRRQLSTKKNAENCPWLKCLRDLCKICQTSNYVLKQELQVLQGYCQKSSTLYYVRKWDKCLHVCGRGWYKALKIIYFSRKMQYPFRIDSTNDWVSNHLHVKASQDFLRLAEYDGAQECIFVSSCLAAYVTKKKTKNADMYRKTGGKRTKTVRFLWLNCDWDTAKVILFLMTYMEPDGASYLDALHLLPQIRLASPWAACRHCSAALGIILHD